MGSRNREARRPKHVNPPIVLGPPARNGASPGEGLTSFRRLTGATARRLSIGNRSGSAILPPESTAVQVLRQELRDLEAMWAAETTSLLEMLRRKDEQIWQLVSDQANGVSTPMQAGRRVQLQVEAQVVGEQVQQLST